MTVKMLIITTVCVQFAALTMEWDGILSICVSDLLTVHLCHPNFAAFEWSNSASKNKSFISIIGSDFFVVKLTIWNPNLPYFLDVFWQPDLDLIKRKKKQKITTISKMNDDDNNNNQISRISMANTAVKIKTSEALHVQTYICTDWF